MVVNGVVSCSVGLIATLPRMDGHTHLLTPHAGILACLQKAQEEVDASKDAIHAEIGLAQNPNHR